MTTAEAAPIAIWDVGDPDWRHGCEAKSRWLRDQGLPADRMYRAEFLVIDAPCARIFCYALNEDGRKYCTTHSQESHDCTPAVEPPRIVPLSGLPPRELLRA